MHCFFTYLCWQSFQFLFLHNNHSKLGLKYSDHLFISHIYKHLDRAWQEHLISDPHSFTWGGLKARGHLIAEGWNNLKTHLSEDLLTYLVIDSGCQLYLK